MSLAENLRAEFSTKFGEPAGARLARGVRQVESLWRSEDGDPRTFEQFVRGNFAADETARDQLFSRMEFVLESLDGHMLEINRDLRHRLDLDCGPLYPFDEILAGYDPSAHITDDFFANKLAFTVLLNFPLTTLEERLAQGGAWSRRQWGETRLAERFGKRVPAAVNLAVAQAAAQAERYISEYNLWMHHVIDQQGRRLFPPGLRLLSHWNLRDQIRADYAHPDGLSRQRMIAQVFDRIVSQTIPAAVVNNPVVDWEPETNAVRSTDAKDSDQAPALSTHAPVGGREPDTRYANLLATFRAARSVDAYSPAAPTLIDRRFEENRQIPEARVRRMLEDIVSSPNAAALGRLVEDRLGRPLEPFDIWYSGLKPSPAVQEAELDAMVRARYPTALAFQEDIPRLLRRLGFSSSRARALAQGIVVDPARGSGHAMGAARRGDKAHLRTRVEKTGMNFKGFSIAIHEMGHNVEQVISLNDIDSTLLAGVPNTAFTEALAFVFQSRDLELLGLSRPDPAARRAKTLNDFWAAFEISGVALVDIDVWHWMYANPDATPQTLREAVLRIARQTWNRYYASIFRRPDTTLLAVYSHMISSFLYLPDYPLGHMIAFQIGRQMERAGKIGDEFERMARIGNVAPDLWMTEATGSPVGPEALLAETEAALAEVSP